MINRFGAALVALSLFSLPLSAVQPALEADDPAPAFTGIGLDGAAFDSEVLAGEFYLLDFWGVWCPPCIRAFPKLTRLHHDYATRGFQVVGLAVLSGTTEEVAAFLDDHEVSYPIVLVETEVPDSYGVLAYPAYYLVDADGDIVRRYQAVPQDLYEVVAEDLEALLGPVPQDSHPATATAPTP